MCGWQVGVGSSLVKWREFDVEVEFLSSSNKN
jgi:hypothetical protein